MGSLDREAILPKVSLLLTSLEKELAAVSKLTEALAIAAGHGIGSPEKAIEMVGYDMRWDGIDVERATIVRRGANH